ncbi:MAG: hypothetical protein ACREDZ_06695 [Kiloniellales bacterium]
MDESTARRSALDRPLARFGALGVALLAILALGIMHRDDLFPPDADEVAADDPAAKCIAQRWGEIDKLVADGTIGARQAEEFKGRAADLCRGQFGQGAGPPPLPAQ